MSDWSQLQGTEVVKRLRSDAAFGLTAMEAAKRLKQYGPNELINQELKGPWRILWEQLSATLVVILMLAAIVAGLLGDYKDALGIFAIVMLISLLGFSQEYRAERAIAALKKLSVPLVKVRRSGSLLNLPANQLVPGDIIFLEAEDLVPADCRLLEGVSLRVQEAALTGVSAPIDKDPQPLPARLPAGNGTSVDLPVDRNQVYLGTVVTYGQGQAIVTETGMQTRLGQITSHTRTIESEPTPLQKRLNQLGKGLAIAALVLVGMILILGLLWGEDPKVMVLTAITLVVAALPEGLPAVVTIALALGAQQMLKRRALIRKLPAVEALGSVTVICSGKTGTLTENRMIVTVLDVIGSRIDLPAYGHWASPLVDSRQEHSSLLQERPSLALLLACGTLCNHAHLEPDWDEPRYWRAVGDPVEGALVMAAAHLGLWKAELDAAFPCLLEVPFTSRRQRLTTVHQLPTRFPKNSVLEVLRLAQSMFGDVSYVVFTRGMVNSVLAISRHVWIDGQTEPLTTAWQEGILAAHHQLIQQGLRVLGLAFRPLATPPEPENSIEQNLIFLGLVGMTDPARPQAKEAVLTCKLAGIRPIMITGDHPLTAWHIAHEIGLASDRRILTGKHLANLSGEGLLQAVEDVSVYAQVSPTSKLDIVRALQQRGHIVAMTGDGANDAPALKQADIGVAMGISGSDVAKEAADMVLLDDNFATIVAAVKEGRIIYDNIRKFIKYLLSSNVGELWVMLLAPFLGMPLPLVPLQILWINLTTDGLPALALGLEPAERDAMSRPPYSPSENFFGRGMGRTILWVGLLMALVALGTGYWYWHNDDPGWQTILFTVLTLSQMGTALAMRSQQDSLFQIGLLSNKPLLGAVILTLGLQLVVIYVPVCQQIFSTVALSVTDLMLCLVLSTIVFWGVELEKWLIRSRSE